MSYHDRFCILSLSLFNAPSQAMQCPPSGATWAALFKISESDCMIILLFLGLVFISIRAGKSIPQGISNLLDIDTVYVQDDVEQLFNISGYFGVGLLWVAMFVPLYSW